MRTCKICGADISHMKKTAKVCRDKKCQNIRKAENRRKWDKRRRKAQVYVECEWCGDTFKRVNNANRFCSRDCARRSKYERNKSYASWVDSAEWDRVPRPDDYSQMKYEQEQRDLSKPNGWKCTRCGKPLRGGRRFFCIRCHDLIKRIPDRLDGDWAYESTVGETHGGHYLNFNA